MGCYAFLLVLLLLAFVLGRLSTGKVSSLELIQVRGGPRRFFLRRLTKYVRDLRELELNESVRIAEEALGLYGGRWASQRTAFLIFGFFLSGIVLRKIGMPLWPAIARRLWLIFGGDRFFWEDSGQYWWGGAVVLTTLVIWFTLFVAQVHFAVKRRVNDFRCAHCKYNLIGLVPQADGPVLCPECGETSYVKTEGKGEYRVVVAIGQK